MQWSQLWDPLINMACHVKPGPVGFHGQGSPDWKGVEHHRGHQFRLHQVDAGAGSLSRDLRGCLLADEFQKMAEKNHLRMGWSHGFFPHKQLPIKPVDITVFWYSEMVRRWWRVSWLYRARCCSGLQCVKWAIDSDNWAVKTSIGLWNDLSPWDRFSDFPHFSTSKSWRCFPLHFP